MNDQLPERHMGEGGGGIFGVLLIALLAVIAGGLYEAFLGIRWFLLEVFKDLPKAFADVIAATTVGGMAVAGHWCWGSFTEFLKDHRDKRRRHKHH